jgi:hypothetical protein
LEDDGTNPSFGYRVGDGVILGLDGKPASPPGDVLIENEDPMGPWFVTPLHFTAPGHVIEGEQSTNHNQYISQRIPL